jgi:hypothetical protein
MQTAGTFVIYTNVIKGIQPGIGREKELSPLAAVKIK